MYLKVLKNSFKTQIKDYCILTGRSRSISSKYKVSRITFRFLANQGIFFGLKKATW